MTDEERDEDKQDAFFPMRKRALEALYPVDAVDMVSGGRITSSCPSCGVEGTRIPYDIGSGPELSCANCEWCWGAEGQPLSPLLDNKLTVLHMAVMDELVNTLAEVINNACADDEGALRSMNSAHYANGIRLLAKYNKVTIRSEVGQNVIADWTPPF